MKKGWFAIPGVQAGDRTLAEQMLGLAPALEEARGKSVLDLGSAEGLISIEFARAGAASVHGAEYNEPLLETALAEQSKLPAELGKRITFARADLREAAAGKPWPCDICLALAIVHKMPRPRQFVKWMAASARSLIVVRLPKGSSGQFIVKHHGAGVDLNAELSGHGFTLERVEQGPRTELVQYWRRNT